MEMRPAAILRASSGNRHAARGGGHSSSASAAFALNAMDHHSRRIDAAVDVYTVLRLPPPSVLVGERICPDQLKKRVAEVLELLPRLRRGNLLFGEVHRIAWSAQNFGDSKPPQDAGTAVTPGSSHVPEMLAFSYPKIRVLQ
jgi:hypothetical protein